MKILIVGAGIGGLSAAIALHRAGHEVTVVEKMPAFDDVGAGIILAPNASTLLADLGVDLAPHAYPLPAVEVIGHTGRSLQRVDVSRFADRYGQMWSLSRPALHAALVAALPGGVRVLHGRELTSLRDTGEAAEIAFNGDAGTGRFDVVVGADGLNSAVRGATVGDVRIRYSGDTCWRGLTANPCYAHAIESWGIGTRIGVVPLPDDRLYYYLVKQAPPQATELDWPADFKEAFAGHSSQVTPLFDVLSEAPPLHHDLDELDKPVWGRGRVFLLGDAAHAMTPNQGQGAAMAIEDAYALAAVLDEDVSASQRRYAKLRRRRVRSVQIVSRRLGQAAHLNTPVVRGARNLGMRAIPRPVVDAQYRRIIKPALDLLAPQKPS